MPAGQFIIVAYSWTCVGATAAGRTGQRCDLAGEIYNAHDVVAKIGHKNNIAGTRVSRHLSGC